MASIRILQGRFTSIFSHNRRLLLNSRAVRSIQVQAEQSDRHDDESQDSKPTRNDSQSPTNYTATSNLKTSARHDLAMIFTCKVCETRSVKTMCRESYEKGVVVARCGGCNNLHLIADHLGWFGESGNVEDLLAARGEEVRKGTIDTLNLTLEDLIVTKSSS
ncbi:DNL-type zinc finger protein isoform X2 [Phalaenopsis equestris]|uniref:DNL-type zinc finger protein isoform X2 n=1 Tax=Phalaenopsis equestris TaxID=78828 RepID=UPI0009E19412|nr:DNL-type zinc finger protein isoform X2 [Phalaenopsis equestris]